MSPKNVVDPIGNKLIFPKNLASQDISEGFFIRWIDWENSNFGGQCHWHPSGSICLLGGSYCRCRGRNTKSICQRDTTGHNGINCLPNNSQIFLPLGIPTLL